MKFSLGKAAATTVLFAILVILSGCLTSGSDDAASVSSDPPDPGPAPSNSAPSISGNPPPSVVVGTAYAFTPTASDPNGDTLTFSIENLPAWADFNSATGEISGVAVLGSEGTYSDIRISVTDGTDSAALPSFSIEVTQTALGAATLSWNPPVENQDGSPLTNLAGYRVYYGTSPGNYGTTIQIDNPGVSSYVVENLAPNTYYFASTAFNTDGLESTFSNEVSKTVQ